MNLDFAIGEIEVTENIFYFTKRTLERIVENFEINPGQINVIVAETDSMLSAVKKIDPCAELTNNKEAMAIGKTISKINNKEIEHNIVLNFGIVCRAINFFERQNSETSLDDENCVYCIAHEFGHCVDNQKRNIFDEKLALDTSAFSLNNICQYFSRILLSEFFACYHSSFCVSNCIFSYQNNESNRMCRKAIRNLQEANENQFRDRADYFNFVLLSAQVPWFILIRYSNLIAMTSGNKNLHKPITAWDKLDARINEVLYRLKIVCLLFKNSYPSIPQSYSILLKDLWREMAKVVGYEFVE